MIAAALFDLDDTLYPQDAWLAGAWVAVAKRASQFGVPEAHFLNALRAVASLGSLVASGGRAARIVAGRAPAACQWPSRFADFDFCSVYRICDM